MTSGLTLGAGMRSRRNALALLVCGAALLPLASQAQSTYPDRPIRVIVASAVGGALDVTTRMLTEKLSIKLGKPIVVENRAGAGGAIAGASVAKAPADGYTLLFVSAGYSTLPMLQPNLGFSPSELAPVVASVSVPFVLVSPSTRPYKTLADFIADAKKQPGQLTFASGGNATAGHLLGTWLKLDAGIEVTHVPFKGESPGLQSLLGDQLSMMPVTISVALPLINSGKLQALAISSAKRSTLLPDVPTIEQQGIPVASVTWFGMLVPSGVPKEIQAKLNEAVNECLQDPDLRNRFISTGVEIEGGSQESFRKRIDHEASTWARVIKESGIKGE
ncbi:tripartite tricarboxylate transporter substrate binding protein [soil metagenome]